MRTALFISPRINVIEDARKAGYQSIIVYMTNNQMTDKIAELADEVFVFDWTNYAKSLHYTKSIHEQTPLFRIYGFGEYSVKLASFLSASLNIEGVGLSAVEKATNKQTMRNILNQHDQHYVFFDTVSSFEELLKAAEHSNYPFIIKPVSGAASMNVSKITSKQDLEAVHQQFTGEDVYICEEFLEGKEISVEAISFAGKHKVIAMTEKYTTGSPHFIETAHIVPYVPDQQAEIVEIVQSVLDIVELETGLSHTEVILTKSGPKIVETHVRPGGDGITDLVRIATGTSMFYALFLYDLYKIELFPEKLNYQLMASNQFFFFPEGKVTQIDGVEELKQMTNIENFQLPVKEGDVLQTPTDSTNRHGNIILYAKTQEELDRLILKVKSTLKVTTKK
ncbi:ATP-grasp domain-containing protein [Bacillus changyiensis]|uniref:ATP-grasp domain-containing protein n=1 Tax=Bacillus changyiensis TaxID=3004103 RepID=UPI0022DE9D6E|nr:ATP-grasp domain-containing protein [Bacillus changyiensis]MDA1476447.1 ATP-grasp domain-containing protein [Bacillus changyiensis]